MLLNENNYAEVLDFLDTAVGLGHCGDMYIIYEDVLREYVRTEFDELLKSAFDAKNFDDYQRHAHTLKSNSRTIGAVELGDLAFALEEAASAHDMDYIASHHEEAVAAYRELTSKLKGLLEE